MDQAPTDIAFSNTSVDENASNGTVVATLSAVDADAGDTFTYALVDGSGTPSPTATSRSSATRLGSKRR